MIENIAFIIGAYLLGSLSSAIIVCRCFRLPDPRGEGSGNPGTTNVLRLGGKVPAIITLVGDVLKGFIPVYVAKLMGIDALYLGYIAMAAFFGHLFPIFFRFQGGKGVATLLGAVAGLSWPLIGFCVVVWLIVAISFRYSSLAALLMALFCPLFAYLLHDYSLIIPLSVMALALVIRHKGNIKRLFQGEEPKIGKKGVSKSGQ